MQEPNSFQIIPNLNLPELTGPGIIHPSKKVTIPQIELPPLNLKQDKDVIIKQLISSMETLGFLSVENIEGYDEIELLQMSKWLFSRDDSVKKSISKNNWNPQNPYQYRGYVPVIPNDPSWKQLYQVGDDSIFQKNIPDLPVLYEQNPYPLDDSNFIAAIQKYQSIFQNLGVTLMRYLAQGLKLPPSFFDELFISFKEEKNNSEVSLSTLRFIHYPTRNEEQITSNQKSQSTDDGFILTTPPHTDSGFLTLLTTFNYYGLQIIQNDNWVSVKPRKNTIVINLGDMFSRITGFQVKATKHRVIDIGCDRYSVPYFFEPQYSAQIPNNIFSVEKLSEIEKDYVVYGDWLVEKIIEFAEYKNIQYVKKSN